MHILTPANGHRIICSTAGLGFFGGGGSFDFSNKQVCSLYINDALLVACQIYLLLQNSSCALSFYIVLLCETLLVFLVPKKWKESQCSAPVLQPTGTKRSKATLILWALQYKNVFYLLCSKLVHSRLIVQLEFGTDFPAYLSTEWRPGTACALLQRSSSIAAYFLLYSPIPYLTG